MGYGMEHVPFVDNVPLETMVFHVNLPQSTLH